MAKAPIVFAVCHAQSVANVVKERDLEEYYKIAWLDDVEKTDDRLRDATLSPKGAAETLQGSARFAQEDKDCGAVLLVVSPLLRTVLTASLLFHPLLDRGVMVKVVVEPAVAEVINEPHDIVENIGRAPAEMLAEARQFLSEQQVSSSAAELLERIAASISCLDELWWFKPAAVGQLPRRVLDMGFHQQRANIREKVKKHLATEGPCSRVYIVAHWGVLYTLANEDCGNLECRLLEGFLDESDENLM